MIKFIKDKFGPAHCDDGKLVKRTQRYATINGIANFYGCCGSWSVMAGVPLSLGIIFGLPWIVPALLVGGGVTVLASAIPVIKQMDKIDGAFVDECKRRKVCPPGWDQDYFCPLPLPAALAEKAPVLAEVFDPAAAVTLGGDIRAMPSIKLKSRPPAKGFFA